MNHRNWIMIDVRPTHERTDRLKTASEERPIRCVMGVALQHGAQVASYCAIWTPGREDHGSIHIVFTQPDQADDKRVDMHWHHGVLRILDNEGLERREIICTPLGDAAFAIADAVLHKDRRLNIVRGAAGIGDEFDTLVKEALRPSSEAEPFHIDKLFSFYLRHHDGANFGGRALHRMKVALVRHGYVAERKEEGGMVRGARPATPELFSEIIEGRPFPPPGRVRDALRRRYEREDA